MSDTSSNNTRPIYCFYTPDRSIPKKKIVSRSFRHKYDKKLYRCVEILHRIVCAVSDYEKVPAELLPEEKKMIVEKDLTEVFSIIQFATGFLDNHEGGMPETQMEEERSFIAELQNAYVKLKDKWNNQFLRQG